MQKLRVSALLLFLCVASFASDRLIIEAKVNGSPVRFMFDTGSDESCLFRKSAQRLGIAFTEPRQDQSQIRDGRVPTGLTEEFRLSFEAAEQKVRFSVIDVPPYLDLGADGLIAWADVTNNVILISAGEMQVSVLETLPADIAQWSRWSLRGDSRCLAIEVPIAEGERKYVYIDTGMVDGVELGDKQWKRWRSENPNAPVTMRAYYTPSDGILVSEQCWARRFSLGNLSVPDTPTGPSAPGMAFLMKDHAAILGLFALTRFDVILNGKSGYAYMKRSFNATNEFHYNKLGAVFAPTKTNCDDLVAHVIEATPAYEAGIRNGDILLKIDDLDVTKWRTAPNVLPLSRFFERSAGKRLQLALTRGGKQYAAGVILRDLFGPSRTPPCDSAANRLLEYRDEAERGDAQAQYLLGLCYEEGRGTSRDVAEAVKWWRKAAEQNHAQAQFNLGTCYYRGQGVAKDEAEAVKWYRKAAEQSFAWAQFNLGACYDKGHGVEKDEVEAVKWFRKAAEQNWAEAQFNLGTCYAAGQGVAKDEAEAVKWYRKAAEQNHAPAQSNLGVCYATGQGVAKDEAEAVKWYRKAAEQNHAVAQSNLGDCYVRGLGVEMDKVETYKWWLLAAVQGNDLARKAKSQLERSMSREQIEQGQKLANDFRPPETSLSEVPQVEALDQFMQNTDPVTAAEKALALAERSLGPDHPEVAACLCLLGDAYAAQGQHALSASLYRRALSIREKALGPDHAAEVVEVLEKLAAVYRKIGSWEKEAEELEKRTATIRSAKR